VRSECHSRPQRLPYGSLGLSLALWTRHRVTRNSAEATAMRLRVCQISALWAPGRHNATNGQIGSTTSRRLRLLSAETAYLSATAIYVNSPCGK
jgi:hypothetical protein